MKRFADNDPTKSIINFLTTEMEKSRDLELRIMQAMFSSPTAISNGQLTASYQKQTSYQPQAPYQQQIPYHQQIHNQPQTPNQPQFVYPATNYFTNQQQPTAHNYIQSRFESCYPHDTLSTNSNFSSTTSSSPKSDPEASQVFDAAETHSRNCYA